VAYGVFAWKTIDDGGAGEGVTDKTEPAFGVETVAVEGNDAGGFLSAVLKGMQPKSGDRRSFRMTIDAEYAAFFAERVAIKVEIVQVRRRIAIGRVAHDHQASARLKQCLTESNTRFLGIISLQLT
jgi:hypothetical protein